MSERHGYPPGVPCWTDVSTSDVEGARAFYGALFGWDWTVEADPALGGYSTALLRGRPVCGLGPRPGDDQPVAWSTFLMVEDAEKAAAAVAEAGGTMASPLMELGEQVRTAYAADPTGAFFGLFEPRAHRGAGLVNEPGTVVWNELVSPDLDAARPFYTAVFGIGWTEEDAGGPEPYALLQVDGRTVGGATRDLGGTAEPVAGLGSLPPHWEVYFEVADTAATVARVRELGGRVLSDVRPTPQGPMATVADPQGGVFSIIASGSTE